MKKLIFALMASSILLSCNDCPCSNFNTYHVTTSKKAQIPTLIKGDSFYFGYVNESIDRFTVLDTNGKGVFAVEYNFDVELFKRFIPYHDLQCSDTFKKISR